MNTGEPKVIEFNFEIIMNPCLTDVVCIENALKGTEIVFLLTGNSY